jgi:hypothetical protein
MSIVETAEKLEKVLEALEARKRERVSTAAVLHHIDAEIGRLEGVVEVYREEINSEITCLKTE